MLVLGLYWILEIFVELKIDILKKIDLAKFTYLAGFHEENKHWRLIFVDAKKSKFFFIDPFSANLSDVNHMMLQWSRFAVQHGSSNDTVWTVGNLNHTKQTDQFNCGVICLMFFEDLIQGKYNCGFTVESLMTYREDLLSCLNHAKKNK